MLAQRSRVGVSKQSLIRNVAKNREEGIEGFYRRRRRRGATVMTAEVTAEAQKLLDLGRPRRTVADAVGVQYETVRRAIDHGRLRRPTSAPALVPAESPSPQPVTPSDNSTRSESDAAAGEEMRIACTRPCERVMAAIGLLPGGANTEFQSCRDVSYGRVAGDTTSLRLRVHGRDATGRTWQQELTSHPGPGDVLVGLWGSRVD